MALQLSVVVVAYDIERELPRTLRSLSAGYQRGISADDYEVIVVDNGSPEPVDESVFAGLEGHFRLVRIEDAKPSPAGAVNRGIQEARGDIVGVMVDGARLVTPGFLHFALIGSRVHPRTGVASLGWYLGFDFQRYALEAGWTKADEDELLASIDWPNDGYRLFEIATLDESSVDGWFLQIFETNGVFLPASVWAEIGGFDERFDAPGGGLVNHDALQRMHELPDLGWVMLLGEGTFHQLHGGVATNKSPEAIKQSFDEWKAQYEELRGRTMEPAPLRDLVYLGELPDALWPRFAYAMNTRLHAHERMHPPLIPPVPLPDETPASNTLAAQLAAKAGIAARQGRTTEAQSFARLARLADPSNTDVIPLLSCIPTDRPLDLLSRERRAQHSVDAGEACEQAGDFEQAEAHYFEALAANPRSASAFVGLTRLRMPGPDYYDRIERIHELLNPQTYLEIGVNEGGSLTHARPPTIAVGVDPEPRLREPISVEFHLYRETSSDFFTRRDVRALFGDQGPSLVFIDGLHTFPAVLEDFLHVEAISDPDTIVLLHDMIPYDELTQRADQAAEFYTGDVWKLLHCFADVRPDLDWFTIRTPPSGLTIVGGLDSKSTVLRDQYDKLVKRFDALQFEQALDVPGPVVENDWAAVAENLNRLRREGTSAARAIAHGSIGSAVSRAGDEESARRVRELESSNIAQRKEISALKRAARREGAFTVALDPESAQAELERMRRTKLYRWTRPFRSAYSLVRYRRRVQ